MFMFLEVVFGKEIKEDGGIAEDEFVSGVSRVTERYRQTKRGTVRPNEEWSSGGQTGRE